MKKSKKAMTLIETLVSIILLSLVIIASMKTFKELHLTHYEQYNNELFKLELRNTKLFFEHNPKSYKEVKLMDKNLFYQNHLLLKEVSTFSFHENNQQTIVSICLKNSICESWKMP